MSNDVGISQAQRRSRILRPLHILSLLSIVLFACVSVVYAGRYDDAIRRGDGEMVGTGFRRYLAESGNLVLASVQGGEVVRHTATRLDPDWIDGNLAAPLHDVAGVSHVIVFSQNGEALYAARDGRREPIAAISGFADAAARLLHAARVDERRLFALSARGASAAGQEEAAIGARSGVAVAEGKPYVLTVALVRPAPGRAVGPGVRAPAVVTVRPLDAETIAGFAARYQIPDMRLSFRRSGDSGRVETAIGGILGNHPIWLSWTTRAPGLSLLVTMLAPVGAMVAFLVAILWLFHRRSETIASDLIASEAQARHLAFHDTLTQLPNRAMMFDRMRVALASARRSGSSLAVHCLDLDRFKEVNDTLGHQAGDELIRKVAAMLTSLCRETDTVARLGGDEFVIIQPDTNASGAALLAERVLKAIKEPIELEFGIVEVGVSIGTTLVSNPEIDGNEALRQADLALYESKEKGRNRMTFFELEMDAAVRMRRALETDLRKALQGDELAMVYQPQIDHRGVVTGLEALLRWKHPERGMIAPAVFIPLAEECGLILDLGEFVFRRVFEETLDWRKRVAVNVSALQLRSPTFMSMLTQLVAEFHVDPSKYEIEITETALLGDDGVTRNNIIMLKQEGFTIALDDFGTGYSSLSTLQRFEVDKIKIDRSFVRNIEADNEADALIDAIIQLGHALKLNIVAEGVETESQRDRLLASGCNMYQGFFACQPMMASEAATMAA